MATYTTFESLEKKTLKENDKIIFKINDETLYCSIIVVDNKPYLNSSWDNNDTIFKVLGIEDGHEFTTTYFGYESESDKDDVEPLAKEGDFKAVTRVVLALFAVIEGKDIEIEVPKEIITVKIQNTKVSIPKFVKPIEVKLNDNYTATITKDLVKVDCQEFPIRVVKKVVEEWNKQFNS